MAKTVKVIGQRPANIPADWRIYNAPRPLYGDQTWQGDFFHGIFYAAVNLINDEANLYIQLNTNLDGWILEYVAEETAVAESLAFYREHYPADAIEIDPQDPDHRRWLVDAWLERQKESGR